MTSLKDLELVMDPDEPPITTIYDLFRTMVVLGDIIALSRNRLQPDRGVDLIQIVEKTAEESSEYPLAWFAVYITGPKVGERIRIQNCLYTHKPKQEHLDAYNSIANPLIDTKRARNKRFTISL